MISPGRAKTTEPVVVRMEIAMSVKMQIKLETLKIDRTQKVNAEYEEIFEMTFPFSHLLLYNMLSLPLQFLYISLSTILGWFLSISSIYRNTANAKWLKLEWLAFFLFTFNIFIFTASVITQIAMTTNITFKKEAYKIEHNHKIMVNS